MPTFLTFFSLWVVQLLSPSHVLPPSAQESVLRQEVSCWSMKADNRAWKKKLWDGYEVSLGPTPQAADNPDQACTGAIYNRAGRVVFRTTGFGVIFDDKETGQDFDGDGKPEVVFKTDTGGGNHCCWAYNVISLSPTPHKLFDIDEPGAVQFEKDRQGHMVIWQRNAGPYGFTAMADAPFAEKVFTVQASKLVDATPEFCSRIFSDQNEDYRSWNRNLTPENVAKLQSTGNSRGETGGIASDLLSRALQNVFCRQFDAALNDLNLWPEATRAKVKAGFADSIKQDYPEFAARLTNPGATASLSTGALPQKINWLKDLTASETFLSASLTPTEQKQILEQVEKTSFDVPDSWESELHVRRVSLGDADGLVIRGTQLLCGGTGNCQTWVFRRSQGNWFNLFGQEAPIISGFGFEGESSQGIRNFFASANSSAAEESRTLYKFDGKFYRPSACFDVFVNANGTAKTETVRCK